MREELYMKSYLLGNNSDESNTIPGGIALKTTPSRVADFVGLAL
jgi:hypothetical protein